MKKVLLTFCGALGFSGPCSILPMAACHRGCHFLLAAAAFPSARPDAQRPALPPYATWLPAVGPQ